ncbi:MAG: hypothetical protein AAF514_12155, partial [Verrucomicrobiota bacterium]
MEPNTLESLNTPTHPQTKSRPYYGESTSYNDFVDLPATNINGWKKWLHRQAERQIRSIPTGKVRN